VLYVGCSVDIHGRWHRHHRLALLAQCGAARIAWFPLYDIASLAQVEAACIAYFAPPCNGSLTTNGALAMTKPVPKKPGPKPKGLTYQIHIMVPCDLKEWLDVHPEGASALARRLLKEERDRTKDRRRRALAPTA
jgi:hypothetical protein